MLILRRPALVSGLILAIAIGCHETTAPRPDNTRPALSRHAATVTAIGDTLQLSVSTSSSDVVWESHNQQVALVTQTGRVTAVTVGDAWVLVFRQPGLADSTHVVVNQQVASVSIAPASISRPLNRTQQFQAVALDAMGHPIPNPAVIWTATGSAATVEPNGLATANALGTSTIHATVKGIDGSATMTVTPVPALRFNLDTIDIGVGQYANGNLPLLRVVADSISPDEAFTTSLSLSDLTVAQLTATTLSVPEAYGAKTSAPFQLMGLAPGITRVTATAAHYTPGTAIIRVSTPKLELMGPNSWPSNVPYRSWAVSIDDSLGVRHGVVQPLAIRIRATTTGVLSPADTTLIMPATGGYLQLPLQRAGSGLTWLVATAPGYRPDSMLIAASPAKLAFTNYGGADITTASVGGGGELHNGDLMVYAGCCQYTDLQITITQRHPEALSVPHSLLLPAMDQNGGRVQLQPIGLQPATDTLIASAPGFLPDTLVFHVTTPTFGLSGVPTTTSVGSFFTITSFVSDSLGTTFFYPASGSRQVTVTSSNPAVIRPASNVFVIGNSTAGGSVRVDAVGPGTATITLSDPSGVFAPRTSPPIVVAPTKLYVSSGYPPSKTRSVGMRQLIDGAEQIATGGSISDSIRLRSTDPTVAQPTTSAVASGAGFTIKGGDRSGIAWIVASAPGLISDSIQISVGRPAIIVATTNSSGTVGQSGMLYIQLVDQTGHNLPSSETVTFRIESTDPSIVTADSTITVQAGQGQSPLATFHFVGAGNAVLRIVDDRNVPYAYLPGATAILQGAAP